LSNAQQTAPYLTSSDLKTEERRELEAVSAALGNSSRLLRLITYIGEKYFQGDTDNLHEYEIATEVFGRSKETFNAGEDAIVRVEAHRLRKRLNEYYAGAGKDHPVQLTIPPGTYIPVFTHPAAAPAPLDNELVLAPAGRQRWFYGVAIAAFAAVLLGGYLLYRNAGGRKEPPAAAASNPQQAAPANAAYALVPLRILAGYSGHPQIDSMGNLWQSDDQYVSYGGRWNQPGSTVARTSNPILYEHWRNGSFYYKIPLRPGVYELHLFFVSIEPDSKGPITFTVTLNGLPLLESFDVNMDALGPNVADERVFRDVSPGSDGYLNLNFTAERALATLNAIEILPGTPKRQLPIRLVTQQASYTDHSGQFWRPDDYFMNGYTDTKRTQISGTADPDLFSSERYGHFTYAIPVDSRDRYTLILHFAEFYFGPNASGTGGAGSRLFRVLCNGSTLLDDFDIFKEAGSLNALTKTFTHLKPSAQGKLNLTFEPILNNATVSGIEVIDESE
jgi:hypothetical protein